MKRCFALLIFLMLQASTIRSYLFSQTSINIICQIFQRLALRHSSHSLIPPLITLQNSFHAKTLISSQRNEPCRNKRAARDICLPVLSLSVCCSSASLSLFPLTVSLLCFSLPLAIAEYSVINFRLEMILPARLFCRGCCCALCIPLNDNYRDFSQIPFEKKSSRPPPGTKTYSRERRVPLMQMAPRNKTECAAA